MDARTIDRTTERLGRLRADEWERLGLAAAALALAVVAAGLHHPLALPLLLGGCVVAGLGVRSCVERWELVDDLALDPTAYGIAEVRRRAERAADARSRTLLAVSVRDLLAEPDAAIAARIAPLRPQLETLAESLEATDRTLEPWAAVACARLLGDPLSSPLLDPARPVSDVRAALLRIEAGFGA